MFNQSYRLPDFTIPLRPQKPPRPSRGKPIAALLIVAVAVVLTLMLVGVIR